jgi:hypothetical protein
VDEADRFPLERANEAYRAVLAGSSGRIAFVPRAAGSK